MRRRYRDGISLPDEDFHGQPWAMGMLEFHSLKGKPRLGLYEARSGDKAPPLGILWRPELSACYSDSISFAGTEKIGERWYYQVWYCETRGGDPNE